MINIPGNSFVFQVHGIEIEGFNDVEVDVQYPWDDAPRRFHEKKLTIHPFYMDKYPVTNTGFKRIPRHNSLPSRERFELLTRLEKRHLPGRCGELGVRFSSSRTDPSSPVWMKKLGIDGPPVERQGNENSGGMPTAEAEPRQIAWKSGAAYFGDSFVRQLQLAGTSSRTLGGGLLPLVRSRRED